MAGREIEQRLAMLEQCIMEIENEMAQIKSGTCTRSQLDHFASYAIPTPYSTIFGGLTFPSLIDHNSRGPPTQEPLQRPRQPMNQPRLISNKHSSNSLPKVATTAVETTSHSRSAEVTTTRKAVSKVVSQPQPKSSGVKPATISQPNAPLHYQQANSSTRMPVGSMRTITQTTATAGLGVPIFITTAAAAGTATTAAIGNNKRGKGCAAISEALLHSSIAPTASNQLSSNPDSVGEQQKNEGSNPPLTKISEQGETSSIQPSLQGQPTNSERCGSYEGITSTSDEISTSLASNNTQNKPEGATQVSISAPTTCTAKCSNTFVIHDDDTVQPSIPNDKCTTAEEFNREESTMESQSAVKLNDGSTDNTVVVKTPLGQVQFVGNVTPVKKRASSESTDVNVAASESNNKRKRATSSSPSKDSYNSPPLEDTTKGLEANQDRRYSIESRATSAESLLATATKNATNSNVADDLLLSPQNTGKRTTRQNASVNSINTACVATKAKLTPPTSAASAKSTPDNNSIITARCRRSARLS